VQAAERVGRAADQRPDLGRLLEVGARIKHARAGLGLDRVLFVGWFVLGVVRLFKGGDFLGIINDIWRPPPPPLQNAQYLDAGDRLGVAKAV
jgi:hypothetical protein